MLEAVITGFADEYKTYLGRHKEKFIAVACLLCFLIGLSCVTQVRNRNSNSPLCVSVAVRRLITSTADLNVKWDSIPVRLLIDFTEGILKSN